MPRQMLDGSQGVSPELFNDMHALLEVRAQFEIDDIACAGMFRARRVERQLGTA